MRRLVLTFVFGAAVAALANAQAASRQTYASPGGPGDLFAADFNKDGRPDIVTTEELSSSVAVFINNGTGGFQSGGSGQYLVGDAASGVHPVRVVAADVNNDGNLDILTANCAGTTGSITSLLGLGNGQFQTAMNWTIPGEGCPTSLALISIPGDTLRDLLITRDNSTPGFGPIALLENTGRNAWQISATFSIPNASRVFGASVADFDRDGRDDVTVVSQQSTSQLVHLLSPFTSRPVRNLAGGTAIGAANAVDLNSDGNPDILAPFGSGPGTAGVIVLFNTGTILSNGNVSFRGENRRFLNGNFATLGWKVAGADVNLDGLDDIVFGAMRDPAEGPDGVGFLLATGAGFFGMDNVNVYEASGQAPVAVAAGDFNADGKMDWAVVRRSANALDVFLSIFGSSADTCVATVAGVKICTPVSGSTLGPTVQISARAKGDATISAMKAYLDGVQVVSARGDLINTAINNVGAAAHLLVVNAWDINGRLYQGKAWFTVAGPNGSCNAGANLTINICSPSGPVVASNTIEISTRARWDGKVLTHTRVYLDGSERCNAIGGAIVCSAPVSVGKHLMTVITWNSQGGHLKAEKTFTVQ